MPLRSSGVLIALSSALLSSATVDSEDPQPYGSFGNGAAMRVSGAGFAARSLEETKELSYKITCVSHNHPEGLKGAEAVILSPNKQNNKIISD